MSNGRISIDFNLLMAHISAHRALPENQVRKTRRSAPVNESLIDFCYDADIDSATISRIKTGKYKTLTVITMYKICVVIGHKMEEYIIDKDLTEK